MWNCNYVKKKCVIISCKYNFKFEKWVWHGLILFQWICEVYLTNLSYICNWLHHVKVNFITSWYFCGVSSSMRINYSWPRARTFHFTCGWNIIPTATRGRMLGGGGKIGYRENYLFLPISTFSTWSKIKRLKFKLNC